MRPKPKNSANHSTSMIGNAEAVGAVSHFEIAPRGIVITDQGPSIRANRHRGEQADIVLIVDGTMGRGFTADIAAVSDS